MWIKEMYINASELWVIARALEEFGDVMADRQQGENAIALARQIDLMRQGYLENIKEGNDENREEIPTICISSY